MPNNSTPEQGALVLAAQATNIGTATVCHARRGQVTTQAADAAANAENSFTLTNRFITPQSVFAVGFTYAGSSTPMVQIVNSAAGSATVLISNPGAAALDAALVIQFLVL